MVKNDLIYIEHIRECVLKIIQYTHETDISAFVKDEMMQDAVIRNFEVIGEAAKRLSENFKEQHNDIPWRKMAGMRDFLIHDYLGVDIYAVWETIKQDLLPLMKQLNEILPN